MTDSGAPVLRVFVSYSWDNEEHRSWVHNFAARLRGDGVDAKLDQWTVRLGDRGHPSGFSGGLRRAGDAENSRRYQERAEANRRANFELEDADAAGALHAHGTALMGYGLYDEAHAYLERALALRADTLGEQDFDTSTSLLKLGILSQLRTRDDEAREYLERALAMRFALCGEDHAATELVRDNLRLLDG